MQENNQAAQAKKVVDPNQWKPGTYKAKPVDWAVGEDKSGNPRVMVLFDYMQGDEQKSIMWFGSFTGGARERTMESLMFMGLTKGPSALAEGVEGKALDSSHEVSIVVKHEADLNGVIRARVSWVNAGRSLKTAIEPARVKSLFGQLDAEYASKLAANGIMPGSASKTPGQQAMEQGNLTEQDVPF